MGVKFVCVSLCVLYAFDQSWTDSRDLRLKMTPVLRVRLKAVGFKMYQFHWQIYSYSELPEICRHILIYQKSGFYICILNSFFSCAVSNSLFVIQYVYFYEMCN